MSALTLSDEQLEEMVVARVAAVLSEDRLAGLARAEVAARIGRLTLAEAMGHLGCANERQVRDYCREAGIPVRRVSRKRCYVLLRDIEAADERSRVEGRGTKVERIAETGKRRPESGEAGSNAELGILNGELKGGRRRGAERPTSNVQRPTSKAEDERRAA